MPQVSKKTKSVARFLVIKGGVVPCSNFRDLESSDIRHHISRHDVCHDPLVGFLWITVLDGVFPDFVVSECLFHQSPDIIHFFGSCDADLEAGVESHRALQSWSLT